MYWTGCGGARSTLSRLVSMCKGGQRILCWSCWQSVPACHSSLGVEHSLSKLKVVGSNSACGHNFVRKRKNLVSQVNPACRQAQNKHREACRQAQKQNISQFKFHWDSYIDYTSGFHVAYVVRTEQWIPFRNAVGTTFTHARVFQKREHQQIVVLASGAPRCSHKAFI